MHFYLYYYNSPINNNKLYYAHKSDITKLIPMSIRKINRNKLIY